LKQPAPPPLAERKGIERVRSPLTVHHPVPRIVAEHRTPPPRVEPPSAVRPVEPPPAARADAIQPVFAPVAPAAPDPRDRAGLPWRAAPALEIDSQGAGSGGGIGVGQGTGLGNGNGSGIGPGSGGGTGGGPYRPGAGISAPSIQREVRPDYTDEGRRRAVEGEVVLEIVVRADGSVGTITLLRGLGAGLDQRAIDAVHQWRFNPATRYGTPVDVMVEVSVEFRLR
jgi:TonB family protein